MNEPEHLPLSEGETATVDAIKVLIDVMQNVGIAPTLAFDRALEVQRDAYVSREMPKAAAMMNILRQFARDLARAEERETSYHSSTVREGSS